MKSTPSPSWVAFAVAALGSGAAAGCTSSEAAGNVTSNEVGGSAGAGGSRGSSGQAGTTSGSAGNPGGAGNANTMDAATSAQDATTGASTDAARDGGAASLGPVAVSQNHRYFLDTNGNPCFWLGDTQWELFLVFKEADAQAILQDRHGKGFNAIQVMILGVGGGKRANASGAKPFTNDDVATPNEAYFTVVDSIVKIAEQLQTMLVIGIYHQGADYSTLITQQKARAWGTWVGNRYRAAPNIIWSMYPQATAAYVPIVRELAAGLAAADGGKHMITVHPDPSPTSSSWIQDEAWLSFNTLQSFSSGFLNYQMVTADYAKTPLKPVVDGEARYEAEAGTTPLMVRNGAYWSILAGGFYSYGHGGDWQNPTGYKTWIGSPGSSQMKILGDFFRALDFSTLVPDLSVISGAPGQRAAARSASRMWAVVYLAAGGAVTIDLGTVNGAPMVDASWMNPETGVSQTAGTFPSSGTQAFTAPGGWADAVLLLRGHV